MWMTCDDPATAGLQPSARIDPGTGDMNWWFGHEHDPRLGLRVIAIPLCCPFVLLIIPGLLALRAHFLAGEPADQCPICRYSLAGLPKGTVCPECGKTLKGVGPNT